MQIAINDTEYQTNEEQLLEIGRLVYERLPVKQRPVWAAELLTLASSQIAPTPEIEAVIRIAKQPYPGGWYDAQAALNALRQLRHQQHDALYQSVLQLAESVADVTYDAYVKTMAEIFYNLHEGEKRNELSAGLQFAQHLKAVADKVNNPEFTAKALALFNLV